MSRLDKNLETKPLGSLKRRRVWVCPTGTDTTKRDAVKQRCRLVSLAELEIEPEPKKAG